MSESTLPEQFALLCMGKGSFGSAIDAVKLGRRVARAGWNGKGMYLELQKVDENSKMQHNYIYMSDVNGKFFPWNPNQLDVLSEDWTVID